MNAFNRSIALGVRGRAARLASAWLAGAFALAVAGVTFAQGTNSIDNLTVSKGSSGNTIVRFTLKSPPANPPAGFAIASPPRSEEHTSELQSRENLVCRLLLE